MPPKSVWLFFEVVRVRVPGVVIDNKLVIVFARRQVNGDFPYCFLFIKL
jgi:hypothetical protein